MRGVQIMLAGKPGRVNTGDRPADARTVADPEAI
jgi:hypothetical protein